MAGTSSSAYRPIEAPGSLSNRLVQKEENSGVGPGRWSSVARIAWQTAYATFRPNSGSSMKALTATRCTPLCSKKARGVIRVPDDGLLQPPEMVEHPSGSHPARQRPPCHQLLCPPPPPVRIVSQNVSASQQKKRKLKAKKAAKKRRSSGVTPEDADAADVADEPGADLTPVRSSAEHHALLQGEQMWQESAGSALCRLLTYFTGYEDVVLPTTAAIHQVSCLS